MILAVIAVAVIVGLGAFVIGLSVGTRVAATGVLREYGFTRQSARLYTRAAKLLNRLIRITELDGDFAADILSPATRKDVEQWIDDYKKEINKP